MIPTNANPYFENHWLTPFTFLSLSQLSFLAKALNCLASYLLPNIFLFTHVSISALEIRVLQFEVSFHCIWNSECESVLSANKNSIARIQVVHFRIKMNEPSTFAFVFEGLLLLPGMMRRKKMFHCQFKLIRYTDNVLQTSISLILTI